MQTFEDLLKSPNDERLVEYYCTSQYALIDIGGKILEIGAPGILDVLIVPADIDQRCEKIQGLLFSVFFKAALERIGALGQCAPHTPRLL